MPMTHDQTAKQKLAVGRYTHVALHSNAGSGCVSASIYTAADKNN